MKKLFIIFVIILTLFSSCRKDDPVPTDTVTPAMARDSLYFIMKHWYYWYNLMPSVDRENYADPYELLEAMRYKEMDKWSFVIDYDAWLAESEGSFVGHGIRVGLDNADKARIVMIYNKSSLYASGVRRGWIVKTVNGYDIAAILLAKDQTAYNTAFGPSTKGITNVFVFSRTGKADTTISSTKSEFTINTVLLYDTIHLSSGSVTGHLVLESFLTPTEKELQTAFAFFKANNVKDFILDLRYNGGGYLDLARLLSSFIAGNSAAGTIFATLQYNDKNQDQNKPYYFVSSPLYSLNVSKLVVITTRSTISASEAVMNGLYPKMSVVSVGDTTDGKPTGMNGWPCGKKYFFWPITFKLGDYFDGFAPDKLANDDITHDFDDRNEACLKEAILYLETGAFSGKGADVFKRSVQFSEKPSWMNNAFVFEK